MLFFSFLIKKQKKSVEKKFPAPEKTTVHTYFNYIYFILICLAFSETSEQQQKKAERKCMEREKRQQQMNKKKQRQRRRQQQQQQQHRNVLCDC